MQGGSVNSRPEPASTDGLNGPDPAAPEHAAMYGLLEQTVQRLSDIVDGETAALRSRAVVDLRDFNNRKSQGLHELNCVLRQLAGRGSDGPIMACLAKLRKKLELNRSVLEMHLEAAREISKVVSNAIRESESDGTYSAYEAHRP